MDDQIDTKQLGDVILRTFYPKQEGPLPIILLLHGWTGDENSMWIFSRHLPPNHILVAPRGLYSSPLGGFSWNLDQTKGWPSVNDFSSAIETLDHLLDEENFHNADFSQVSLVGFSQGASLAYAYIIQYPSKFLRFVGLSGFLPEDIEGLLTNRPLEGKQGYITHGTQDHLVPVDKARKAVKLLESAGAKVTYCEDDVGHKLSLDCFIGMENFFKRSIGSS